MMQISHAATGAAIGKFMPNPILAFLAGIIIHFVIDKIPHYWSEKIISKKNIIIIDYIVTVAAIALLATTKGFSGYMIYGMAGSLIVDILLVGVPVIYRSKLGQWHTKRQKHLEMPSSFVTDLIIIAISIIVIFFI